MKKKFDIRYDNEAGEDMQYYLKQFKKEAMKKAEEIFGEPESTDKARDKAMPNNLDTEHFDMKDMYKTSQAKPDREEEAANHHLKEILEEIKAASHKIASEIFKND